MGLATFAIGLLPTYAQVGLIAPVLLVLVRVVQGLAFGAEWGGAILMSYEHAPWKTKGKFTGIVQAGFPVGLLLANLVLPVQRAPRRRLGLAGAVPASIVLVTVGLVIRSKVPESPVFEDVKNAGTSSSPRYSNPSSTTGETFCAASVFESPRPPATRCRSPT